jgi:hypothetical protein
MPIMLASAMPTLDEALGKFLLEGVHLQGTGEVGAQRATTLGLVRAELEQPAPKPLRVSFWSRTG